MIISQIILFFSLIWIAISLLALDKYLQENYPKDFIYNAKGRLRTSIGLASMIKNIHPGDKNYSRIVNISRVGFLILLIALITNILNRWKSYYFLSCKLKIKKTIREIKYSVKKVK